MFNSAATQNETETSINPAIDLIIDRTLLLKSLSHTQSVVEKRNTLPILSNVKLEAYDNTLRLTATDTDIAIIESISAETIEDGALTVPAHTLYEIIRKLPDGSQISLKGNSNTTGKLEINSGSCQFSLPCLSAEEFPVMDKGDMPHSITLSTAELIALIDKPRFAISSEETRYYLNGIFLHAEKGTIRAVATDGHRLAKIEIDAPENTTEIAGIIIPKKTVLEAKKLIEETETDITISLSDSKICFTCDNIELTSKLIDGTFPDYKNVIPKNNNKSLTINATTFTKAVDRVSTVSFDKTKSIKISIANNILTLSTISDDNGTANEEIEVSFDHEDYEAGFNSRYILDMMAGIEGEEIELIFDSNAAPVLVKDTIDNNALYVIMPMRV